MEMTNDQIKQSVKEAVTECFSDKTFLSNVVQQFAIVFSEMKKESDALANKKFHPSQLQIEFSEDPLNTHSFLISAAEMFTESPSIVVFEREGIEKNPPTPVTLDPALQTQIIDEIRRQFPDENKVHTWGTLKVIEKNPVPESQSTENRDGGEIH